MKDAANSRTLLQVTPRSELSLLRRRTYWAFKAALLGVAVTAAGATGRFSGGMLLVIAGIALNFVAYLVIRATMHAGRLSADAGIRKGSSSFTQLFILTTGFGRPRELLLTVLASASFLACGVYQLSRIALNGSSSLIATLVMLLPAAYAPVAILRGRNTRTDLLASQEACSKLTNQLRDAQSEKQRYVEFLDVADKEMDWLKQELAERPKIVRKTYKVLTIGASGSGKTSLTLKWANPLIDLGMLAGTSIERYERTVSQVNDGDVLIDHVLEIHDWGGEHAVDAQSELVTEEVQALLLVVDLAYGNDKSANPDRIQDQLREFQPEVLKYFFGPKTIASCKTVVLFINKSDLLSGTPAEVERAGKAFYQRLIDDLRRYSERIDIRIFVGSALYGLNTHHLFSYLVERILPQSAYDRQLL
jgi:hypothetical protein